MNLHMHVKEIKNSNNKIKIMATLIFEKYCVQLYYPEKSGLFPKNSANVMKFDDLSFTPVYAGLFLNTMNKLFSYFFTRYSRYSLNSCLGKLFLWTLYWFLLNQFAFAYPRKIWLLLWVELLFSNGNHTKSTERDNSCIARYLIHIKQVNFTATMSF